LILSQPLAFDDQLTVHRGGGCAPAAKSSWRSV
jgi:hypothetical protein